MTHFPPPVPPPPPAAVYSGKRATIACPHCQSVLKVRSSRPITSIVRQITLACLNDECGATFGADFTITHSISPGARPNPTVQLRTVPPRRAPGRPANDDQPARRAIPSGPEVPPANDDDDAVATTG